MARRQTAAQRREHLLDAAVAEFAESGYHAASTTAIARRAGISQPYIYALYREELVAAARDAGAEPEDRLQAMGDAYLGLIADRADVLCQLQAYAAAGDAGLREPVREEFLRVFEAVRAAAGVSREEASFFFAGGIFLAIAGALEIPPDYWPGGPDDAPD
jgi:AcrR family transcriptional regulator